MGSSLAFPAAENGHLVRIVGTSLEDEGIAALGRTHTHPKFSRPFPDNVEYYYFKDWKKAVEGADFVIGGVSSFGVEWFLDEVLRKLDPSIPVLSVTKGLRSLPDGSLISYPRYWENALKKDGILREICAVGGPCTSEDLVAMDPTEVAFCGRDRKALEMMRETLQRPYYHVSLTDDVIGLECAVALKNAYALAVTLAVGLNVRDHGEDAPERFNSQAGTFTQAVREMHALMQLVGGTFESEAIGLGDLFVTISHGRTRGAGILMGKGLTPDEITETLAGVTLESFVITRVMGEAVRRKAGQGLLRLEDFPLLMHVVSILEGTNKEVTLPWRDFTFEQFS